MGPGPRGEPHRHLQLLPRRGPADGRAGGGSIVNLASTLGVVAFPGTVAYVASKGAVVQLTRALALEWAAQGCA